MDAQRSRWSIPRPISRAGEAYYPILTEQSQRLAARYRTLAQRFPHLYLCGRLADFKYYNMDEAVLRALVCLKRFEGRWERMDKPKVTFFNAGLQ